jgi:hypothetical protein
MEHHHRTALPFIVSSLLAFCLPEQAEGIPENARKARNTARPTQLATWEPVPGCALPSLSNTGSP